MPDDLRRQNTELHEKVLGDVVGRRALQGHVTWLVPLK